jgi:hypothetical protein
MRLIDAATAEKLSSLYTHALTNGLTLSLDFNGYRSPETLWIIQMWDEQERIVVSGRGKDARDAIMSLHDKWIKKNPHL